MLHPPEVILMYVLCTIDVCTTSNMGFVFSIGGTRTLETPDHNSIGSPAGSVQDVKEHSGSYQSSDSEFY